MKNISKCHFLGEGEAVMDIPCSTAEGEADQNWMAVDVRRGALKLFILWKS